MKLSVKIAALLLCLTMLLPVFFACKKDGGDNNNKFTERTSEEIPEQTFVPDSEKGVVTAPEQDAKIYNIIFALATVPPVLAALDSIASGYETYAIIERGKTYNGIDKLEYFNNAGFDPENNLSTGFTSAEFDAMVEKVKELRAAEENSFFYFYAQDGTALRCAAVAANADIPLEDFHVIMCEDGTGAYKALRDAFVDGKSVSSEKDESYEAFLETLNKVGLAFTSVMAKTTNKNGDEALKYSIANAYALSVLPNFTYWLQDGQNVEGILRESGSEALLGIFGIEENDTELSANLKYQTIAEKIGTLSEEQKSDYLTLMYGDYYEDTYAALTRSERAGTPAPADKLVFIGARYGYYPKFASDEKYGIGGLSAGEEIPQSYAELDEKYKTALLFANESDYQAFLDVMNDTVNYARDIPDDVVAEMKSECFNLYINYIYTLKFAYLLYGEEYDIILKGHPREVIGSYLEWGNRYTVTRIEGEGYYSREMKYSYDKLLDNALLAFHANDSIGKYIGMVPFGTAAENLAYLGADITVCGLPSSTYSGLDTDIDVLFIMCETDESICGDDSQVKDRFKAGNLTFTKDGVTLPCIFYNTGNTYKFASQILKDIGNSTTAGEFEAFYKAWLSANRPGSEDIDAQGFGK